VQVLVSIGEKHYPRAWLADLRLTLPAVPAPLELAEHVKKVMADAQLQDGVPLEVAWVTLLVINGDVPVQQIDWSVDHSQSAEQLKSRPDLSQIMTSTLALAECIKRVRYRWACPRANSIRLWQNQIQPPIPS